MSTSRKRARRAPPFILRPRGMLHRGEGRAVRLGCLLRWVAAARQPYHGRQPTHVQGAGGLFITGPNHRLTVLILREEKRRVNIKSAVGTPTLGRTV